MRSGATGRGRWIAAAAAALIACASAAEPRAPHPWLSLAPPRPAAQELPPLRATMLDAIDWSATLRGVAGRAELAASLRARYRLDAERYLRRKRADADDLDLLLRATRDLDHHETLLAWLGRRCEGVWRAWQVALLDAVAGHARAEAAAYGSALRTLLSRTATTPATPDDMHACRLDPWTRAATLAQDAPAAVAEESRVRLSERADALMLDLAPPTAWLEVDAVASAAGPGALSLRAGIDVPLPGSSQLALGLDGSGPDVTITWHSSTLDDAITLRHRGQSGDASATGAAEREEALARRAAEAQLARADARLRWLGVCGGTAPAVIHGCLLRTRHDFAERDAMVGAIEAELAALQAELALIAASGHDPIAALGGAPTRPAKIGDRGPPPVTGRPGPRGAPR